MAEFTVKDFTERAKLLKEEHLLIRIISVEKRTEVDSYEGGCDPSSTKYIHVELPKVTYTSIIDAFRDLVGDKTIEGKDISTIDPNIYQDSKDGGAQVVKNNTGMGNYRCTYNREENSHGRKPSKKEQEDFESGKINLKLADYEIHFNLQIVGLEEGDLAELLGINNW